MTERLYSLPGIPRVAPTDRELAAERPEALFPVEAARRFLARRWRLILGVAALCVALAGLAVTLVPKSYTGTAVLIVDPRPQKVTAAESVLGGIGSDVAAVESQVEILESSTLAKRVVASLGLDRSGELTETAPVDAALAALRDALGLAPAPVSAEDRAQRVLARFSERLHVRRRGLTYVLEVTYVSGSAQVAAQVANGLAAAYLADQQAVKLDAAKGAAGMLNARLDDLRTRARDAERAVSTFKNQNDIVDIGAGLTLLDREVAEQSQQLAQVRGRSAEASARLDQARRAMASADGGGTLAESLQSSVVINLRNQYAQVGAQLAELRNTLGPRHPSVSTAEAQSRTIAAQIQTEIARLAKGLRNEFESATSRERTLAAQLDRLKRQAGQSGQARVRLAELEREAQASKVILEQYLVRQKETSEQQTLQSADARILTPAAAPLKASSPQKMLLLGLALIGGLGLGFGAAAAVDAMEPGLRAASAVQRGLGVPLVGVLPRVPAAQLGLGGVRLIGDGRADTRFGDAIRMLALPFSAGVEAQIGSTLLVTSAVAGEGKSTVAEHLAEAFARQGRNVLLVDIDTRNPRLTRARQALNSPGLLDALGRSFDPGSFIQHGTLDAVSFLPVGIARNDLGAAELFFSPALGRAIADLRRRFDLIVLDGPSLLQGVEGKLLLAHADQSALVVAWGQTSRGEVRSAVDLMTDAPGNLGGVVFNKVDTKAFRRYA